MEQAVARLVADWRLSTASAPQPRGTTPCSS
jgi:hypothetical protein